MDNFKNASNLSTIKSNNRSLILRVLNSLGQTSRAELARITGLTKMAVTNIVNDLLSEKIIYETGVMTSSNGRKPILLTLSPGARLAAGLYISRDFVYANVVDLSGNILGEARHYFELEETEQSFLACVLNCMESLMSVPGIDFSKVLGIGIASIGPLDTCLGLILDPPNFRGLKSIPIVEALKGKYGLYTVLENDMNASATAEKLFGKGKNISDFIYVGVTNGIGSGIVLGNNLFRGRNGFAGEIGHTTIDINGEKCPCGNFGCLELYASISNTVNQVKSAISLGSKGKPPSRDILSWRDIVDSARAGDELCLKAVDRLVYYLSIGLVNIINTFDPETIFLGHDIALAGELVLEPLNNIINRQAFSRTAKQVKIELSSFKDYAPCIGAPALILEKFFNGDIV